MSSAFQFNVPFTLFLAAAILVAVAPVALQKAQKKPISITEIVTILKFVVGKLRMTYRVTPKKRSIQDPFSTSGGIASFQIGLMLAGFYIYSELLGS